MKIILILASLAFSYSVLASLQMKPGKWKVEAIIKDAQGATDPIANMREAMSKMTPAQRKEMEAAMAKVGKDLGQDKTKPMMGFNKDGMTVCYTKEMLQNGLDTQKTPANQKCKASDQKITSTSASVKYTCEDGASGQTEVKVIDETHILGVSHMTNAKGIESKTSFKATFLKDKCD